MYAREIGALAGVVVPIVPMAHEYLVLEPSGLPLDMPTMRDPSLLVYFRPESGGLIMGGYERDCAPWSLDGIPADFNGKLLEEDWPRFEELMQNAIVRVPSLEEMGVVRLINGPEAFTPDGEFILGPSDVRGFWVAAGFCAHGLAGAGGMGRLVAEWIVEGTPSLDVWHMDSRRFGAAYRSLAAHGRADEGGLRDVLRREVPGARARGRAAAPHVGRVSAARRARRGLRGEVGLGARELVRAKRRTRETSRFVRAAGRASCGRRRSAPSTPRAARPRRSSTSRPSRRSTCPERAPPRSSKGCAPTASRATSAGSRTRRCSTGRGGIECDFTVTRLADDRFRIVTGTAFGQHDLAWIRQHAPDDGSVHVADVTSAVRLPRPVGAGEPRDPAAAHHGRPRERGVPVHDRARALGRLGAVPRRPGHLRRGARLGALLPDRVRPAPVGHALGGGARRTASSPAGYKAIDSLRLEKGYRVWGADISPEDTPFEAGSSFAVKLDKDFVGREALDGAQQPERRLRCLVLSDPRAIALGSEPVRVGDAAVGRVTSGGFGYTTGSSIAYAYLPAEHDVQTEVAVEIFGTWVDGAVTAEPLFDPAGERVRS